MFTATIVVHKKGLLAGEGTDSPEDIDRVKVKIPALIRSYAVARANDEATRIGEERGLPTSVWEVCETID